MLAAPSRIQLIRGICERPELSTYDPYDIWMTPVGFWVKNAYNHRRFLGLPFAASVGLFDLFINDGFRFFGVRREYSIVRALAAQSLLQLYRQLHDPDLLWHANRHLDWLKANSCKGYSGPCWGLGFRYAVGRDLIYDPNMPLTTMTPYALEAFVDFTRLTGDPRWMPTIHGIHRFLERDIVILQETEEVLVTSYGAMPDRKVNNAVSYMMYSYALLLPYLDHGDREKAVEKIRKLYNYLKRSQETDGSWLYSPESPSFIDCFHSCIIIKNLVKTSRLVNLRGCAEVVDTGYAFVKEKMFVHEKGLVKRFAKANKPGMVRFDLYDNAEMLHLAQLLGDHEFADALETNIARAFVRGGRIFSQIDWLGIRRGPDRLRWAVMPYIFSLAARTGASRA